MHMLCIYQHIYETSRNRGLVKTVNSFKNTIMMQIWIEKHVPNQVFIEGVGDDCFCGALVVSQLLQVVVAYTSKRVPWLQGGRMEPKRRRKTYYLTRSNDYCDTPQKGAGSHASGCGGLCTPRKIARARCGKLCGPKSPRVTNMRC